jgi:hypothetical protein
MGTYSEYLDKRRGIGQIIAERKAQLNRTSALRDGRDILVFASDLNKNDANIQSPGSARSYKEERA